jgi:5-methyltetrahydrofolate--homocysteine methyltransferase
VIIVGEGINTTRKSVQSAVKTRDAEFIRHLARVQAEAGAHYIDLNAGTLGEDEPDSLVWLVETVQDEVDAALCLDSPDPVALEAALESCKSKALVNSITAETDRFESVVKIVTKNGASVVALCMDDRGVPENAGRRVGVARDLCDRLVARGVAPNDIFVDPLVQPIGVSADAALEVIESVRAVKEQESGVHIIAGLSNVSFGLPARKLLNRAFLVMLITAGLDSALLDPLDKELISLIAASEALLNKDEFCAQYLAAFRAGRLNV